MFLIDALRPKLVVELGTHYGVSYCAFCQAVKQLNLDTCCVAVDTWAGDPHAGPVEPEVLWDLRTHHDPLYGAFSHLIQSTFDEAVERFPDSSIDLLHIDGYHTYESVKHDFSTWLPKVSQSSVVLLHDTSVRHGDFGVWRLWGELKSEFPHFEFDHGYGLGVLFVGPICYPLEELLNVSETYAASVRAFFHTLGMGIHNQVL
jgi:hypothetical protein